MMTHGCHLMSTMGSIMPCPKHSLGLGFCPSTVVVALNSKSIPPSRSTGVGLRGLPLGWSFRLGGKERARAWTLVTCRLIDNGRLTLAQYRRSAFALHCPPSFLHCTPTCAQLRDACLFGGRRRLGISTPRTPSLRPLLNLSEPLGSQFRVHRRCSAIAQAAQAQHWRGCWSAAS